ncbi:hypothetical protein [Nonomuraea cavernae]|uniref:Beta-Ig-H3/fasciclin n=1 Tax=Nonomuraea cavernae TaxID=2045107 RepID=A0A918DP12_9ACTN|nr:hypothetical protein [Nonomuraea cavernae]MCA2187074.1 hypothetical protein [Nonomuraea cavernae]GGO74834.1 hypothetical protein GCM10012289_48440 [Nonomuraea cavernae]
MIRSLRRGRAALAVTAAAASLALMSTPAQAADSAYSLTLFSDTQYSTSITDIKYDACDDFIGTVPGRYVGSYINYPPANCEVILHTQNGDYELCVGRRVTPQNYRQAVLYTIRLGSSNPCWI